MKRILFIILGVIAVVVLTLISFLLYFWVTEWSPKNIENVGRVDVECSPVDHDTLKIISWNIGYGGLGDNMDFFYDGGKRVQDSRERTIENINEIISFLKSNSDADFILLQEVDSLSKRNYDINLYDLITSSLSSYTPYYALNYNASFVPIPIASPIGRVKSGVLTLSRFGALSAVRYHYPSSFPFPVRLFNLKRCLLVTQFETRGGKILTIGNTHNSAFDDGGMRREEFRFLKEFLSKHSDFIVAGDWNSNPPLYLPTKAEIENKYFSPLQL
ncbi:MAG: endonuclease/exonuclease/phosphatase family protein, partial [Rikenellaceae bacterium]